MNYEQKYREVLERARLFQSQHPTRSESDLIVAIFPELAESEDKKIRKEIATAINLYCTEYGRGTKVRNDMLVWLEKQKELDTEWIENYWKHHKVNNPDSYDKGDEITFDHDGFVRFCSQFKQKPVETDASNIRTWKYVVDAVLTEREGIGQYLDMDAERIAKKLQQKFGNIGQNPIEWSPMDNNMFNTTLENLTELQHRFGKEYGKVGVCINWLNALKQRIK